MKKINIFIILPSQKPSGPIKGAFALANNLVLNSNVNIIFLKKGKKIVDFLNPKINTTTLKGSNNNFIKKIFFLREILNKSNKNENITISFCFSADLINIFCKDLSISVSSVRGNLFKNYKFDYGFFGKCFALFHILILNFFDEVIAMSKLMQKQLNNYLIKKPIVIPNFINERQLSIFFNPNIKRDGIYKFIFIGSLGKRKNSFLLVKTIENLSKIYNIKLDIIGFGPEYNKLVDYINKKKLHNIIKFHGELEIPFKLLSNSDVFVLPSESEGISRAALESLFLGIPIVLRDVDSNSLLINKKFSGNLFSNDDELGDIMIKTAIESQNRREKNCLLPEEFREENIKKLFNNFIYSLSDSRN